MSKLILVTGGAGFVGSNLIRRLVADGNRVISLDNYFTGSRENHVRGAEYREGHTKDIETLVPESPDLVYHLGEYSRVEKSFEDIDIVWDLNTSGTFAVLEFVRRRGSKIVYAGSSTKFGDGGEGKDQSPYAWTKARNTELVKRYATWFGISYAITYFYNVYGPGERADAYGTVIEIFRQNRLAGRPLTVVAPGTQKRNFTHVDDVVEGLVLVGEKGEGDEFGLGSDRAYPILEVANLFGGEVILLPERPGNRMGSEAKTDRSRALGWAPRWKLADYVEQVLKEAVPATPIAPRVLVFSTTFHPVAGPAEHALHDLMAQMPDVQFDIVTSAHTPEARTAPSPLPNATVHHVGWGTPFDKYLLPIVGTRVARKLVRTHAYLVAWSVMASYGTLAALASQRAGGLPLLVTLADQHLSWYERLFLRLVIQRTDLVYASRPEQGVPLSEISKRVRRDTSVGTGDAFTNQLQFVYRQMLAKY